MRLHAGLNHGLASRSSTLKRGAAYRPSIRPRQLRTVSYGRSRFPIEDEDEEDSLALEMMRQDDSNTF